MDEWLEREAQERSQHPERRDVADRRLPARPVEEPLNLEDASYEELKAQLSGNNYVRGRKLAFLAFFREIGIISRAAHAAGCAPDSHSKWKREDAAFARAFDMAERLALGDLEVEARRRAVYGTPEPVIHKGEQAWVIDPITKAYKLDELGNPIPLVIYRKSDRLLEQQLAAKIPEVYGKKPTEINVSTSVAQTVDSIDYSKMTQAQRDAMRLLLTSPEPVDVEVLSVETPEEEDGGF